MNSEYKTAITSSLETGFIMKSLIFQISIVAALGFICGYFLFNSSNSETYMKTMNYSFFDNFKSTQTSHLAKEKRSLKKIPSIGTSLKDPDDNFDKDWPSQLAQRVQDTRCQWVKSVSLTYAKCKKIAEKCHARYEDYDEQDRCVQYGMFKAMNIKLKSIHDR